MNNARKQQRRAKLIEMLGLVCPDCGREMIDGHPEDAPPHLDRDNARKDYLSRLLTIDHIRPRSKVGTHALDNLRLCCRSCNMRKGSRFQVDNRVPDSPLAPPVGRGLGRRIGG